MILLDSLYVNNGGAKVLLDYLVEEIEKKRVNCFYLFDDRCINDYKFIPNERKAFLKATLYNRHHFYKNNKSSFTKVFCFGNLPPSIKLKINVFTYFHQLLFLKTPQSSTLFVKLKLHFQTRVLNFIKCKTDYWLVQSELVREGLSLKYNIDSANIKLMPFYPSLQMKDNNFKRRNDGFIYISNGPNHKNHQNLLKAFCNYFDEYKKGVLHLTISDKFPELIQLIKDKKSLGYPIINHGYIDRNDLVEIYQSNKYLIFPSLAESFGLGLIEAMESGCDVIGADLPYTYAVCNPSIVFDPLDVNDIERALFESQSDNVKKTEQLVFNRVDELINLLCKNQQN